MIISKIVSHVPTRVQNFGKQYNYYDKSDEKWIRGLMTRLCKKKKLYENNPRSIKIQKELNFWEDVLRWIYQFGVYRD